VTGQPADHQNPFGPAVSAWASGLGRLRDVVRQHVLASQLAGLDLLADGPVRVLDAGCGQGTQALLLARAGHQVTGLDPSAALLARFAAALRDEPAGVAARVRLIEGTGERAAELTDGEFGLVLCHGVLMYQAGPVPLLAALSAVTAPGAVLSLLVRNGLALAMRPGLCGDWKAAREAFGSLRYVNRLRITARAHTPAQLDAALRPLGWRRRAWFGVRVFTDHRDGLAPEPAELEQLLAAEREAGHRDPYRRIAALLHLVYAKAAP
jgi:S-adenosylmethionine-dependent methyltransferase